MSFVDESHTCSPGNSWWNDLNPSARLWSHCKHHYHTPLTFYRQVSCWDSFFLLTCRVPEVLAPSRHRGVYHRLLCQGEEEVGGGWRMGGRGMLNCDSSLWVIARGFNSSSTITSLGMRGKIGGLLDYTAIIERFSFLVFSIKIMLFNHFGLSVGPFEFKLNVLMLLLRKCWFQ